MSRERRLRIGLVSPRELVSLLNWQGGSHVEVPLMPEKLPADVQVANVFYDWSRDEFSIVLQSESFPQVPEREMIPLLETNGPLGFRAVRLRKGKDGKYGVPEENPLTCGKCKVYRDSIGDTATIQCDRKGHLRQVTYDSDACKSAVLSEQTETPPEGDDGRYEIGCS